MPLNTSQILQNRYRIVKLIGQGGFGAVYRAWDMNLSQACAVKENLDVSAEARKQFSQEMGLLRRLHHNSLPRIYDYFFLPGTGQYMVMDFIEGEDLQAMLTRRGRLPEAEVIPWIVQICDALNYMHSQKPAIIHRDIKPANIIVTPEGRAMLVDFGISKVFINQQATTIGARAVTPGFSPPEQYGNGSTDARSDIYALGALMYTLLTGIEPAESVQRMAGAELQSPHVLNPNISSTTSQIIVNTLHLNANTRTATAAELQKALSSDTKTPSDTFASIASKRPQVNSMAVVDIMNVRWEIRVERILMANKLTGLTGGIEKAAGRFALIFMTATNHGLSQDTFMVSSSLEVQDAVGSRYKERRLASVYAAHLHKTESVAYVNPDQTGRFVAVFDISQKSDYYRLVPGEFVRQCEGSILLNIP